MNERQLAPRAASQSQPSAERSAHEPFTEESPTTPQPICFAHRGARAYAPENTLLAFTVAFDLGAEAIECDVQSSRDGRTVIIHDGLVDRTTNGTGEVAQMSFAELSRLDAGRFPRVPQRIPTLEETLALVHERHGILNLEIKGESLDQCLRTADVVAPTLETLDDELQARLLVSSFEHPALTSLKERMPWLRIAALFGKEWRHKDLILAATHLRAEAIHPALQIADVALVEQAHAAGLRVNIWTVNSPHDLRQCVAWGVDGIFTDFPERVIVARSIAHSTLGLPLVVREDA